ncbi:dehydrogenase with different specificitie [Lophium mytilinum]|uniref:Dehydrogenase with different specificitie n=1 Tax=Lophium mytilinum TaxID=390894 RepID=A0A6A6R7Z3_9PEZI|nr:dehydrogenase with different specificitie [Lophium mytilinum]
MTDTINKRLTLQGKVAIVTGASRGIGAGVALDLAKRGAKVTIAYTSPRSSQPADDLISQIKALENGAEAIKVQADLSQVESADKIVAATRDAFGPSIDILVNNAGVEMAKPILESTAEDYAFIFDVNVRGAWLMVKAVVPHLRAPGRIINLSSVGGRCGFENFSLYSASKAAIEGMTRGFAAELGPAGHTVNAVGPGPIQSEMLDQIPKDLVDMQKKQTPMGHRVGTVEDVALIIGMLAEEQSQWVTGQTISASGGFLML